MSVMTSKIELFPAWFFSFCIRDALHQQFRGCQATIWPAPYATSQSWDNDVSETPLCHLWRPLLW